MHKALKSLFIVGTTLFLTGIVVNEAHAVPISPDKYFLEGTKGETFNETLKIIGRQEMTSRVTLYLAPYGMIKEGDEHTRTFYIPAEDDFNEPANWITLGMTEVNIGPGETVEVPWTMTLSDTSTCGTNLAAILVSDINLDDTDGDGSEISLNKSVVSQIHVDVDGRVEGECTNLVNLQLDEFKVNGGISIFGLNIALFNYDNVPFLTRINNDGSLISRSPQGYIEVTGLGDKITIPFNDDGFDIYPGTARKFDDIWIDEEYPADGNFLSKLGYEVTHLRIGKYTAQLGVTKDAVPNVVATDTFWIIPWRLVTVIIGTVVLIVVVLKGSSAAKKSKKQSKSS